MHLYSANNIDWMNLWIERGKQHHGSRLSWQPWSELLREAHRNEDANVTQREIDLA